MGVPANQRNTVSAKAKTLAVKTKVVFELTTFIFCICFNITVMGLCHTNLD